MRTAKTTRLLIQHNDVPDSQIVGVLEQLEPEKPTKGRKIALVLHGTMGHKDYIYQKRLAQELPLDSYRFDFRGNHETKGDWKMDGYDEDLTDLQSVVQYLTKELGYVIDLLVGHSRGSVVAFRWLCTAEEAKHVTGYINVSGRYRMEGVYFRMNVYKPAFEKQGFFEWKVNVARKPVVGVIYPKDLEQFAAYDTSLVWDRFPAHIDVLTVHGLEDKTVPAFDAVIYARALGARSPGTHMLHFIDKADHNFTGRRDEVTEVALRWWQKVQNRSVKTGLWDTGVRPKL